MNNNLANIKKSIFFLNKNECVAIPTETVYGLAANAYSSKSVKKIYALKKRHKNNPSIVHYSSLNQLQKDCELNKNFLILYKKFCPGPITFVLKLKKKSRISRIVTNNKKTVAVRFPKNKLTQKLLKLLKYPLAAPSANISTKISPVSKDDVKEEFGNKIKFILDGGRSIIGLESTIISLIDKPKILKYPLAAPSANISTNISPVSKEDVKDEFGKKIKFILDGGRSQVGLESTIISLINKPQILRLGGIKISEINKLLKTNLKFNKKNIKTPSPGQSKVHYSPGIPLKLNVKKPKLNEAFILIKKRKFSDKNFYYLTKNKNLKEAAKNLYKTLRMIKRKKYKSISVEKIPNIGFGQAINDRLIRASKL